MTKIIDLFGHDTTGAEQPDWHAVVEAQHCPFVDRRCYKEPAGDLDRHVHGGIWQSTDHHLPAAAAGKTANLYGLPTSVDGA